MPPLANIEVNARQVTGRGPVAGGRCTDCLCCLIFVLALVATLVVGGFGFHYGNTAVLNRLVTGRDLQGRLCGIDHGVTDFKYAYFTIEQNSPPTAKWTAKTRMNLRVVCTSSCPQANSTASSFPASTRPSPDLCAPDMYPQWCTWYGGNTVKLAHYCVDPEVFATDLPAEQWLSDLRASKFHLLLVLPVSVLVGFMFLGVLQRCGATFVWAMLVMSAIIPCGLGFWVYYDAHHESDGVANEVRSITGLSPQAEKYVAILLWAISGFILLLACCFYKTVDGVVAVVKVTTKFLQEVPSQMLQPIFFGCLHTVVIVVWFVIFIPVATMDAKEGDSQDCLAHGDMYCLRWDMKAYWLVVLFLLLMIYWVLNFLHACSHFGTACAVGAWFFTKPNAEGAKIPAEGSFSLCDVRRSVKHSGSLAYGSLCVGFAKVCKLLLFWVTKDEEASPSNGCLKCVLRVVNGLAECVEQFIEFVSEHAYVEIALGGNGFCASAKKAMDMAKEKPILFTLVGRVALVARMMGILVISMVGTYVVAMTLVWWRPAEMRSVTAPIVVAAICASIIGEVIMHPFSAAARACLHCYVLDSDDARDTGRPENEHTPQEMIRFVQDHGGSQSVERSRTCATCCPCF